MPYWNFEYTKAVICTVESVGGGIGQDPATEVTHVQRRHRHSGWSGLGQITFSRSLDLSPDCIGTHVLLSTHAYTTCIWAASDMVHSTACSASSSASQSSPTHKPIAETPHQPLLHRHVHAWVIFHLQWPNYFWNAGIACDVGYISLQFLHCDSLSWTWR